MKYMVNILTVTTLLRFESLVSLIALGIIYQALGGTWSFFFTYFLLPDLSLLLFLFNVKMASFVYNIAHSIVLPAFFCCLAVGLEDTNSWLLPCIVWLCHIHFDRTLGYGLKFFGSFHQTHLGAMGQPQ